MYIRINWIHEERIIVIMLLAYTSSCKGAKGINLVTKKKKRFAFHANSEIFTAFFRASRTAYVGGEKEGVLNTFVNVDEGVMSITDPCFK